MFFLPTSRNNGIAYLLWRWLLPNNGKFQAHIDYWYSGTRQGMNDYDALASGYTNTNIKPDKLYSILPTVINLAGECMGKVIADIGCGSGFFTTPFANLGARGVYGIDSSAGQIKLAESLSPYPNVRYYMRDVFVDDLPDVDMFIVPFVLNYARSISTLVHFLSQLYRHVSVGGKVIFVVDLPNGKSLKRFGAAKTLLGGAKDETIIRIDLFNGEKQICTLNAAYYTPHTIERLLKTIGFKNISWHKPIVSEEGINAMEPGFWEDYTDDPELGYLTAEK
ncbi:MAG: class I SAM-dependent methyltransferase [Patescibacteria group bacterium]